MSEVSELTAHREKLEKQIRIGDLAERIAIQPDFKELILQEFCINECARYAQVSGDPTLTDEQRRDAISFAQAAGHLRRWLSIQVQLGRNAAADLGTVDAHIVEAMMDRDQDDEGEEE